MSFDELFNLRPPGQVQQVKRRYDTMLSQRSIDTASITDVDDVLNPHTCVGERRAPPRYSQGAAPARPRVVPMTASSLLLDLFLGKKPQAFLRLAVKLGLPQPEPRLVLKPMVPHTDTPVHLMAVAQYLLQRGADPDRCDTDGMFPAFAALHFPDAAALLHVLLQAGADAHIMWGRYSLLDAAVLLGRSAALPILLDRNVLPTRALEAKRGPLVPALPQQLRAKATILLTAALWDAVERDHTDKVRDTLLHGARVATRRGPDQGITPLCLALERGVCLETVELLLAAGADPNDTDASGSPVAVFPILRFEHRNAVDALALLLSHGLDPTSPVPATGQSLAAFAHDHAVLPAVPALLDAPP